MSDNAVSKSKGYANFIPEVWGKKLSASLESSGVMMKCVNTDYEGEINSAGDTVHVSALGDISVYTYSGGISSYYELSSPSTELIIDQEKFFAFKVNDISKAQSNIDIMEKYLEKAKNKIDLVKDTFLLSKHADVPAGNTVGSVAEPVALTSSNIYSTFVQLAQKLKNSNALSTGQKPWLVIDHNIEALLLQSSEFTHASNFGDDTIRDGSIGRIAGMDVLVSTNFVPVDSKYYIMAGINDAITFASKVINTETIRDQDSFSDLVRGLYVYGAKTVVPNALAKVVATIA